MSPAQILRMILLSLGIWLLSATAYAQHGWSTVYQGTQSFADIHFLSPSIGWVTSHRISDQFSLWKTVDGGLTWSGVIPTNRFDGCFFSFYDDQHAYLPSGWYAAITDNQFATLDIVQWSTNSDTTVDDVVFLDSTTLIGESYFLCGDDDVTNQIFTSTDGGRIWNRQVYEISDGSLHFFTQVCLSKSGTALVVKTPNFVYRGTNMGNTWVQSDELPIGYIDNITSSTAGVFYASGSSSQWINSAYPVIARSVDDGLTWQVVWSDSTLRGYDHHMWALAFPDSLHGWVMGDSGLTAQTRDGGTTWESYYIDNCGFAIASISFIDSTLGWAVDGTPEHARVYRYGTPQTTNPKPVVSTPTRWEILSVYPNPFNAVTSIKYSIPQSSRITIKLWDMTGREVATLFEGQSNSGRHEVRWNAEAYSSGIYFCQLQAGENRSDIKKLLLVK